MTEHTIAFRQKGATARARHLRREETDAEYRLWRRLSGRELGGYKFVRQVPLGPYVVDFLCRTRRLVVELDGEQHAGNDKDTVRSDFLTRSGYSVLRFWNHEVLREREAVLDCILAVLEGRITQDGGDLRFTPATLTRSLRESAFPVPGEERATPRISSPSMGEAESERSSEPGEGH